MRSETQICGTAAPGIDLIGYGEGRVVLVTKEFERRGVKSISFTDSKDWIQMCSLRRQVRVVLAFCQNNGRPEMTDRRRRPEMTDQRQHVRR